MLFTKIDEEPALNALSAGSFLMQYSAKTEIDLLVASRTTHGFKIPNDVISWQSNSTLAL